jgi:putative transposase
MKKPFRYFKTSTEIIRLAVMMYVRFPLSLRNVEDLLHERGIDTSHETVRAWWNRFGPTLVAEIRKKRDRNGALRFLRKAMKRYGRPEVIVTDRLRSYPAAMKIFGNEKRQETGRWLNNRAENSHQPFRRRGQTMANFKSAKSLLKFAGNHASNSNDFN